MTEEQTSEVSDIDTQRQAEIDALAAQLASAAAGEPAPAKAPRKRASRRVTAADPSEFAASELAPGAPSPEDEPAVETATAAVAEEGETPEATESPEPSESGDADSATDSADTAEETESQDGEGRSGRSRRGRSRSRSGGDTGQNAQNGQAAQGGQNAQNGQGAQNGQQSQAGQPSQQGNRRGRGRGPIGDDVEPEILEDDVLIPVAGILDVLDNYAFVRTTGYLPGPTDVYVSLGQVKKYGLRKGDAVVGAIRQPRDGEQPGRQKYNALVKVDSVNGQTAEQSIARIEFAAATPIRPFEAIGIDARGIGLHRGQRALAIGGSASGKTPLIAELAERVSDQQSGAHLMVILVSPRPEEVTDFRRSVKGEVVVAGLELSAEDHVTVIDLAVERAKRLVELGIDVVVLIDSITGLGRAHYALAARATADDPTVVLPAKRLFASARAVEEGSALTIIATASDATPVDRLVVGELRSVANAVIQLG